MAWNDSEDKTKIFLDKKIFQWAKNNPEFKEGKMKNLPIYKRGEMLGHIASLTKNITVVGIMVPH